MVVLGELTTTAVRRGSIGALQRERVSRMTTNAPVMYNVIDGPGIQETIDSFTWAFTGSKRPVTFRMKNMLVDAWYEIVVPDAIVTAIKYESGAPGLFLLEFNAPGWTKCHGYYNGHSRTGHFTMTARR